MNALKDPTRIAPRPSEMTLRPTATTTVVLSATSPNPAPTRSACLSGPIAVPLAV
ncbi:MAG: hypothetical protein Q8Q09_20485 [Deltaproteobacteria bacterium]|nr:hypothetical protein [Deltaproteobacteria bacterium]